MKALLIAEKPSLKNTIEEVYNKHRSEIGFDIDFFAQAGHLFTLKSPDELDEDMKDWSWDTLPFEPKRFEYKLIPDTTKGNFKTYAERYKEISDAIHSGRYDIVIDAGDPDQEGQLLIWETLKESQNTLPVKRFWSNDLTDEKVLEALLNLRDDEHDPMLTNLLNAAFCRQHSDYRFGMNVSRAATIGLNMKAACGRVKTSILAIVCKREEEIKNFVPKTSYGVQASFSAGFTGDMVEKLPTDDEKDPTPVLFKTREEAERIMQSLLYKGRVVSYSKVREKTQPPKFYKLATCQIAAGKYGFTSDKTLSIIQSLYEKKVMSYPRTDCEYLSSNEDLRPLLNSAASDPDLAPFVEKITEADIQRVHKAAKWTNDAKLKDSGHSALVPTKNAPDFNSLSEDEKKIYHLVARQFVAAFLPPKVEDKTTVYTNVDGSLFKSVGKILVSKGYTELIRIKSEDVIIPPCKEGDVLDVNKYDIKEKTTTCPKRFRDSDLISVCEAPHKFLDNQRLKELGKKLKLGTPATRASIIKELIDTNHYLKRQKDGKAEYIVPSETGEIIFKALRNTDICKVDMTGEWEEELEQVRQGTMSYDELEESMKNHVRSLIEEIKNSEDVKANKQANRVGSKSEPICKCPLCGGDIVEGQKSFFCTNWKEKGCKEAVFKKVCESTLTSYEAVKLIEGQTIKKKIKWKDKTTGKMKEGESELRYNQETFKTEFVRHEPEKTSYKCPNCGEMVIDKGRLFECSCGFKLWKTACGKELTKTQIESFFKNGSTGLVKGMKSKKGTNFDAELVLSNDKKGTTFKFPPRD